MNILDEKFTTKKQTLSKYLLSKVSLVIFIQFQGRRESIKPDLKVYIMLGANYKGHHLEFFLSILKWSYTPVCLHTYACLHLYNFIYFCEYLFADINNTMCLSPTHVPNLPLHLLFLLLPTLYYYATKFQSNHIALLYICTGMLSEIYSATRVQIQD